MSWTKRKFLSLPAKTQHKHAAEALRIAWEKRSILLYRQLEQFLGFPQVDKEDFCALSERYHMHLKKAGLSLKEHNLLPRVAQGDTPSAVPFLPINIYLDSLRSAYNVGSILRTTEALRLGTVYFSSATPFIDNPKVQKTSMNTHDRVPCHQLQTLDDLPRPLIALETVEGAPSVFDFTFPKTFTLMLGNEEHGLSKEALAQADHFVRIPLFGEKNSINVAAAFAIVASLIRCQEITPPPKVTKGGPINV